MRLLRWVIRRRLEVIAFWVGVSVLSAPGLLRLENDNSPEAYFVDDADALERYRRTTEAFGDFDAMRLVISGQGVWTPEGLDWLASLERDLPLLRGVVEAAGLYGRHQGWGGSWPALDPDSFRRAAVTNGLDLNAGWVSRDGSTVTLLLALRRMSSEERRTLIHSLEDLAAEAPSDIELRLTGLPVLSQAFDDAIVEFAGRFFPLLILLAVVLLFLALRSARDVARALAFVAVCQTLALGLMGYAAATLNMVMMVLIPLLFVLALATAIHLGLTCRRFRQRGHDAVEATLATYREKGWPVLWAGVTTWVGFGSLSVSPAPPVHSLGVWLAVGITLITLAAFTLLPALLAGGPPSVPQPFESRLAHTGRRCAETAANRRWTVLILFALAAIGCGAGVARLGVETSLLTYFRPGNPVRATTEHLESVGIGSVGAELFLTAGRGGQPLIRSSGPGRIDDLRRLDRLTDSLRAESWVRGALSAADIEAEIGQRQGPSEESADPFLETALAFLVTEDGRSTRIALQVPMVGFAQLETTFEKATKLARELFPEADGWVTGRYPLVLAAQRTLLRTMIVSLSLTVLCVAVTLGLILRDPQLTLLAMIPNLWPVGFVLGLMGWLGTPVESATVAIAAVVLGLAVDDTFFFLGRYRVLERTATAGEATAGTLEATAGAHVLSTVVLAAGFGACGLASFVPVSRFGALVAAALGAALLADLLLFPALLATFRGGHQKDVRSCGADEVPR